MYTEIVREATVISRYIILASMVIGSVLAYKVSKRSDLSYNMMSLRGTQIWLIHGIVFYISLIYFIGNNTDIPDCYVYSFNLWSSILRMHMLFVIIGVSLLRLGWWGIYGKFRD